MKISDVRRIKIGRGEVLLIQCPANVGQLGMQTVVNVMNRQNERRLEKRLPKIAFVVAFDTYKFSVISRREASRISKKN